MDVPQRDTGGITRRRLLRTGVAAGATIAAGSLVPGLASAGSHTRGSGSLDSELLEATVSDLQAAFAHCN